MDKYPFMVRATYKNGGDKMHQQAYNFATLGEALNRRSIENTKGQTVKVEMYVLIDETFPHKFDQR